MPAVLVHGVPDTPHLWDAMRTHLARTDVVTPALPGFGAPLPAGFDATKETYVEWLIGEIARLGEPVDLVGHDWGSLLVQRVVCLRPDLVRTWACGDGPIDADYCWHDTAQIWQTPGAGEQFMREMMVPEILEAGLVGGGYPAKDAAETVRRIDETMKDCILRLYRSAIRVGAEWQADVERITRPALIVWSDNDPYVTLEFGERLARRVKGRLHVVRGCGHWWPLEQPAEVARVLTAFWSHPAS